MATNDSNRYPELKARVEALGCTLVDSDDADAHILDPAFSGELTIEFAGVEKWCGSSEAASRLVPTDAAAWFVGANLAIEMLELAADLGLSELALEDDCRDGRPQTNVFLTVLTKLRALHCPTSDVAFAAVLSELIASYADDWCSRLWSRAGRASPSH
jgi:hypothetical protein